MFSFGINCKPCKPWLFKHFETYVINILNNKGDRIQPCLSPIGHSKKSVCFPLHFTAKKHESLEPQ